MRPGLKLHKIPLYLSALLLSIAILQNLTYKAFAAPLGEASLSIGFAPTAVYLTLKPGQEYKAEATFWNLTPSTIVFDVKIKGFKQIEDIPGTSRILTDFEESNDPYSASSWVTVDLKEVELKPNQYFTLPYTIKVPKDVAAGEFHTTIFLQSKNKDGSGLSSSYALSDIGSGPVILINSGDELDENADIEYFTTDKSFYEKPPVTFETRYLNKGNTHITPAGDIILYNFLGQEFDRIPFNPNHQSLLRSTGATYKDTWNNSSLFFKNGKISIGPVKAKLITTYKSEFPGFAPLSATTAFWILPWKIILLIVIILGLVIYQFTRKREKRYNNDSINQSTNVTYINNPYEEDRKNPQNNY